MIRYLKLAGEEFPCKFGFSAFMRIKAEMSEIEQIVCIVYHAIKIAAKKVNPTILKDERFADLETFADEIFSEVATNDAEMSEIAKAIESAQGSPKEGTKKKGVRKAA